MIHHHHFVSLAALWRSKLLTLLWYSLKKASRGLNQLPPEMLSGHDKQLNRNLNTVADLFGSFANNNPTNLVKERVDFQQQLEILCDTIQLILKLQRRAEGSRPSDELETLQLVRDSVTEAAIFGIIHEIRRTKAVPISSNNEEPLTLIAHCATTYHVNRSLKYIKKAWAPLHDQFTELPLEYRVLFEGVPRLIERLESFEDQILSDAYPWAFFILSQLSSAPDPGDDVRCIQDYRDFKHRLTISVLLLATYLYKRAQQSLGAFSEDSAIEQRLSAIFKEASISPTKKQSEGDGGDDGQASSWDFELSAEFDKVSVESLTGNDLAQLNKDDG